METLNLFEPYIIFIHRYPYLHTFNVQHVQELYRNSEARICQMWALQNLISIDIWEKLKILEIFDQPYLRNRSTDFYGTKTKLYREVSSIGVCGKEIQENHF